MQLNLLKNTCEGEIDLSMTYNFTRDDISLYLFFSAFYRFKFWNDFYVIRKLSDKRLITVQQTFVWMKTSWRRLEDVFRLRLQKTSWRRLQDVLIKTNMFALDLPLQKTFSRRLQDVLVKTNIFVLAIRLQDVFKTFSRRLQDVFKTFSRRLQDVLQKRLQDIFKTSSRRFEDVFKTSSRRLAKISSRRFQGVPSS